MMAGLLNIYSIHFGNLLTATLYVAAIFSGLLVI